MASSEVIMATNYPTQEAGGPMVYVMMDKDNRKNTFAKKTAKGLSITQIILGVTSILCQVILIFLFKTYPVQYENIAGIGEGIYCGVFFLIAGCLGLLASRKPSTCNISAFMTLSIIASLFGAAQIILASFNLIGVSSYDSNYDSSYDSNCDSSYDYRACPEFNYDYDYGSTDGVQAVKVVLVSIMILAGLVEGIIAIISSAVCCRGCCCTGAPTTGQVMYLSQGPMAQTTPQPRDQTLSQLPSYGDVVQQQLETKDTQKYESGNYMKF